MFKQGLLSLALIGAGAIGFSVTSANAVTLPPVPQKLAQAGTDSGNLVEVKHRRDHRRELRRHWDRDRDGHRCRTRFGDCRHYYRGWYYSSPWWTLPLIGGSIVLGNRYYDDYDDGPYYYRGYGSAHVNWCANRYRSYNPRNNTWVSYSGVIRQCISPYS